MRRQDDDIDDETFTVAVDTANLSSTVVAGATTSVALTIDDDAMAPIRTDLGMCFGAIGERGALVGQEGPSDTDLALKYDRARRYIAGPTTLARETEHRRVKATRAAAAGAGYER